MTSSMRGSGMATLTRVCVTDRAYRIPKKGRWLRWSGRSAGRRPLHNARLQSRAPAAPEQGAIHLQILPAHPRCCEAPLELLPAHSAVQLSHLLDRPNGVFDTLHNEARHAIGDQLG